MTYYGGQDSKTKEWIYGALKGVYNVDENKMSFYIRDIYEKNAKWIKIDNDTLSEGTGVLARNMEMIFEHDIIELNDGSKHVVKKDSDGCFRINGKDIRSLCNGEIIHSVGQQL